MKPKYSTASAVLLLMALSAVSVAAIQQDAFAQTTGMSVTAMADKGSDKIMVSGQTMSQLDVAFKVTSPSGNNVVGIDQVTPDTAGNFNTTFVVGDTWNENGFYSITAKQGSSLLYNMTVFVEVTDGMTEDTMATQSSLEIPTFGPVDDGMAAPGGLSIQADAVVGSTTIGVTGTTDRVNTDVTFTVTSPNGNRVGVGQVTPGLTGEFALDITTGGSLWKQDGDYAVSAQQGSDPAYSDSVMVEIKDGVIVPEFGTIAAMVLAVAIISIIAVTARSRLSVMPRY